MEWKIVKLGDYIDDIAAGPFGSNLKVECFVEDGFPIIDGANLRGFTVTDNVTKFVTEEKARSLHRSIATRGEVIVTISGNVGQIAYIPNDSQYDEYLVSQRQFRVRFKNNISVPYLVYYMHSREGQYKILSFANQTGVPALAQPLKNFRNIEFPLPPLETQRRIAAILSSLDDKIENNNRINRNLEAQAQALFKSWFVDFEPFGGKMPEDWREGTLGDIAHVTSGKRPPLKESLRSAEVNIPLIGAADIMGYTNTALYSTPILVTGRVGTHGIVQRFDEPCWPSDNTLVVEGSWYEYIYQTMNRIDYHNMNRGSTQPLITQTDLKCQRVIIPSQSILDKFEIQAGLIFKRILNNKRENDRLATLRDTLLPKLMKGEIEV